MMEVSKLYVSPAKVLMVRDLPVDLPVTGVFGFPMKSLPGDPPSYIVGVYTKLGPRLSQVFNVKPRNLK